jgi:hypothetical protein
MGPQLDEDATSASVIVLNPCPRAYACLRAALRDWPLGDGETLSSERCKRNAACGH